MDANSTTSEKENSEPHLIRITRQGKMSAWITFALEFFEKNEHRPIVLHTLPDPGTTRNVSAPPQDSRLPPCTTVVPRLISIAEIIKREYLKKLEARSSSRLTGLHQYNQVLVLENTIDDNANESGQPEQSEDERAKRVIDALKGKNHVKQKQTPYMRITLSQDQIPELTKLGATYQRPMVRKLSKSARARAKKREMKAREAASNAEP